MTPALLLRYSRTGPRYTSYPTVPHWTEDYPLAAYHEALAGIRQPASVYVHVKSTRVHGNTLDRYQSGTMWIIGHHCRSAIRDSSSGVI